MPINWDSHAPRPLAPTNLATVKKPFNWIVDDIATRGSIVTFNEGVSSSITNVRSTIQREVSYNMF
jgi:hypothetical protein